MRALGHRRRAGALRRRPLHFTFQLNDPGFRAPADDDRTGVPHTGRVARPSGVGGDDPRDRPCTTVPYRSDRPRRGTAGARTTTPVGGRSGAPNRPARHGLRVRNPARPRTPSRRRPMVGLPCARRGPAPRGRPPPPPRADPPRGGREPAPSARRPEATGHSACPRRIATTALRAALGAVQVPPCGEHDRLRRAGTRLGRDVVLGRGPADRSESLRLLEPAEPRKVRSQAGGVRGLDTHVSRRVQDS